MKKYLSIFICIFIPTGAFCEDYPGKAEGLGPPYTGYETIIACGDYIKAKENHTKGKQSNYLFINTWISGYITGLNESLERGGNVLGKLDAKIQDFYIMVENYCRQHPTEYLGSGIGVSLKKLTPVDWKGNEY